MSNLVEVVLPAGVNAVEVRDIPVLLANAIHPQTESAARVLSALKKQMLGPDGSPLPGLHPLTSNPLHDRTSPEQRLLEAIFVAPPDEEAPPWTDWALLNLAWEELPDFKFPLPEAEWTKYADAWEKSTHQQDDWRLVPEWDTESTHAYMLNLRAQAAHRAELVKAIQSGNIVPLSHVTRLPEPLADSEGIRTGFIPVEEFRRYAGRFEIGVTLAPNTPAPSATAVSTVNEETARHIEYLCARKYPDYDAIKPERVAALRAMAMPGQSSGVRSRGQTLTADECQQILAQAESFKSDLRTRTADEIASLANHYRKEDSQSWQTRVEQERVAKELAAASKVDWDFWRAMRKATLWQACALSIPLDPDSLKPHPQGWMAGPGGDPVFESKSFPTREIREKFEKRLRLLRANRYDRTVFTLPLARYSNLGPDELSLPEFAAWGLSIGWDDMPPAMVSMAQSQQPLVSIMEVPSESRAPVPDSPSVSKHTPKHRLQETAILEWLEDEYGDAKALPKPQQGKSGPKAAAWLALAKNKGVFQSRSVFDKAWDRLRASEDIQDAQ